MNLVASQCQHTITASARLDTYMSLKVGGRAIGWVKFCGKARLKAKFANNRVLCGLFVLNRGTRKVGCGAKFGLVQALEQTESARSPPKLPATAAQPSNPDSQFQRLQSADTGPTGESSQPAAGQPSTRWGWRLSGSMDGLQRWEFVAEELEKLQRGAMPFEVEYRLS